MAMDRRKKIADVGHLTVDLIKASTLGADLNFETLFQQRRKLRCMHHLTDEILDGWHQSLRGLIASGLAVEARGV